MCGIAGIFGLNGQSVWLAEVEAMCATLIPRGPDDAGYYVEGAIGLGMRRLSIIDLDGGKQPVSNEDGSVRVVLNGEIYNFRGLRRELEAQGHVFASHSDTEVIVHLYEEYGAACVEKLRGMFAFALWDARRRRLLLARDRLGVKPLYFGEFDGRLVFASELKALLALPQVERRLNWGAVGNLFAFLSTPREESIISGVHKLPPGHVLTVEAGGRPVVTRYWELRFKADHSKSEAEFVEELRALLEESVRLRMVSDVPVGAFLSGGIDSSAVVATMARLSPVPVKTFAIGFTDAACDESHHARQVARAFGTEHHELILEPDVSAVLEDLVWHLDEPFGDSSAIPTYMVSQLAAREVKVVLSGDGGDEVFAGYDRYRVEARERRYRHIPLPLRRLCGALGRRLPEDAKGRRFLRHLALEGSARYLHATTLFGQEQQTALFNPELAEQVLAENPWRELAAALDGPHEHWLSALQDLDFRYSLPLDILTKVDRMSMAHSLEAREPLLDHKLVEFAATIPPRLKLRGGTTKHIFKQALRGILPDAIIDRPKQGFWVPLGKWFRNELEPLVNDLLLSQRSRERGVFNPHYIANLLRRHRAGRPQDLELWTLISFELWCRRFLDGQLVAAPEPASEPGRAERTTQLWADPKPMVAQEMENGEGNAQETTELIYQHDS